MKLFAGILFFSLSLFLVGCKSTARDTQDLVEDTLDRALNAPNTDYIDPNRLADTKEDAIRQVESVPREKTPSVAPVVKGPSIWSGCNGVVMLVNPNKNFAVIDFGTSTVPSVGAGLSIFRGGRMVGSVKITEPIKAPLASADIVNGTLASGDLALK